MTNSGPVQGTLEGDGGVPVDVRFLGRLLFLGAPLGLGRKRLERIIISHFQALLLRC